MSPKRLYRVFAVAETITWTLLIAGMILKYGFGVDMRGHVGGGIHGFVFLAYAVVAVLVGVNQRWNFGRIAFAVLTAIVPYATIPFERGSCATVTSRAAGASRPATTRRTDRW